MTTPLPIDATTARHTILHLQGLTAAPNRKLGLDDLYEVIEALGFVQVDSIQWVERAHHMILHARNQTYRPAMLHQLCEDEQRLFENWTHDASFIPAAFYPYWKHKFRREWARLETKFQNWQGGGFLEKMEDLRQRIERDGPLMARDLEKPKGKQEMWQWHDGKAALEYMWRTGDLAIKARRGFQKVYDVVPNCLHADHCTPSISEADFIDWACREALERLGFGTAADIARYFDLVTIQEAKDWIDRQDGQRICSVTVTGANGTSKELIARADIEDLIDDLSALPKRVRALSPFDPVIRDRNRLTWLWGFDYRIEIYVPEAKRRWGYYVFPLLERDHLIGRVDMRADRKRGALTVKKLWLEPKVKLSDGRQKAIQSELQRQARFCGVDDVVWDGHAHPA